MFYVIVYATIIVMAEFLRISSEEKQKVLQGLGIRVYSGST